MLRASEPKIASVTKRQCGAVYLILLPPAQSISPFERFVWHRIVACVWYVVQFRAVLLLLQLLLLLLPLPIHPPSMHPSSEPSASVVG